MKTKGYLLIIFIILILLSILFYNNYSAKIKQIDPKEYEIINKSFVSEDKCNSNKECKEEFNENWECIKKDGEDKCICIITDENKLVCGKDGKNYRNPSEIGCLGIDIDYEGKCEKISPILPIEKECSSNKDCPGGYYCKEQQVCEPEGSRTSCYTISNCVLRKGCDDGFCNYIAGESPEICPQDCKETLQQKNCGEINEKIGAELFKINYCSSEKDCVFSGANSLGLSGSTAGYCCGIYYNKNSDFSILKQLDEEYIGANCALDILCACVDVRNKSLKCINNKCTHFG